MSTLAKLLLVPALAVAFGVGVALAAGGGDDDLAPVAAVSTGTTTTDDGIDVSGPCDEAEHANDPRCSDGGDDREDDDRSGPGRGCDDHDDDSSGHGRGGDDDRDDDGDDR